mgnify:CR=1 FL=1|tara:strand:+ start:666 stop:890 length:225 start_codon:yes stop_codon:yes gene_type:complete
MIGVHYIKYVNDKGYVVKDEVAIDRFAVKETHHLNMNLVQAYRDWMGCNHVLRTQTHFLFCEIIQEAEIIEEYE